MKKIISISIQLLIVFIGLLGTLVLSLQSEDWYGMITILICGSITITLVVYEINNRLK